MFNLFNFGDELTLPEQVEQNKQNIEILAEEVEKLGFSPRGEYDALTEYVKNDLVFYDGKMYAVKSDVAVVGVVPTNTEYWQQITGDVRGEAGAPGAPGAPGAQGETGDSALVCFAVLTGSEPPIVSSTKWISVAGFNREPKVNDKFNAYMQLTNGDMYLLYYRVIEVAGGSANCSLVQIAYKITGPQGAPGEIALVYDHNILAGTLDPEQSEQLLNVVLPFANFNRTPALNEDFVGVLVAQNIEYLAQCEVQSIIGSNVVSIVASGIKRITGENGTNGTNGANGRDALQMTHAEIVSAVPTASQTLVIPNSAFNRNAQPNDVFTMIADYSSANRSFLCIVRVDNEVGGGSIQWNCTILSVVETTGQAGQAGATLQKFLRNTTTFSDVIYAINNTKGRIEGYMTFTIDGTSMYPPISSIAKIDDSNYRIEFVHNSRVASANTTYIVYLIYSNNQWTATSGYTKIANDGTIAQGQATVSTGRCVFLYWNDVALF